VCSIEGSAIVLPNAKDLHLWEGEDHEERGKKGDPSQGEERWMLYGYWIAHSRTTEALGQASRRGGGGD
jgi:hypothetical protein